MVTLPVKPIDHLPLLTIHNLAMISDWLEKNGEVFVDIGLLRSGGGSSPSYFVQSMRDLKYLLWEYGFCDEIRVRIYRHPQLLLRGTANTDFLEKILRTFGPEQRFCIIDFEPYPSEGLYDRSGRGYFALLNALAQRWGSPVALGIIDPFHNPINRNPDDVLIVRCDEEYEGLVIERSCEVYAPYDADPACYQWLVELWQW